MPIRQAAIFIKISISPDAAAYMGRGLIQAGNDGNAILKCCSFLEVVNLMVMSVGANPAKGDRVSLWVFNDRVLNIGLHHCINAL